MDGGVEVLVLVLVSTAGKQPGDPSDIDLQPHPPQMQACSHAAAWPTAAAGNPHAQSLNPTWWYQRTSRACASCCARCAAVSACTTTSIAVCWGSTPSNWSTYKQRSALGKPVTRPQAIAFRSVLLPTPFLQVAGSGAGWL